MPWIERQSLKKIVPDEAALLRLLHRWRDEAMGKGHTITRPSQLPSKPGVTDFWPARWLAKQGIEYVIHSSSIAVSQEHKWGKTDRLDTTMLHGCS